MDFDILEPVEQRWAAAFCPSASSEFGAHARPRGRLLRLASVEGLELVQRIALVVVGAALLCVAKDLEVGAQLTAPRVSVRRVSDIVDRDCPRTNPTRHVTNDTYNRSPVQAIWWGY